MASAGVGDEQMGPLKPVDGTPSTTSIEDGELGDTCRICRGEGTTEQPLFYPCKCSGSIKYVHQECLLEWLSHSQKKYCELCKTSFRFTKLYDQSMPDVLPLPLFARKVALYGARKVGKWLRYVLVIIVWACCLPWTIRQVWRGLFWLADGSWMSKHELQQLLSTNSSSVSHNNITNNATLQALTSATQIVSMPQLSPIASLLSLLTGEALLRGLLRLVSSKAFSISPLMTNINGTSAPLFTAPQVHRRPSLLSDVQSLNSFTRNAGINGTLIDILEGQLVCLCIIAGFILVFLIREWVINQQPVHMMPDPDQTEAAPAHRPQNEEVRQVARRRRPHVHHVVGVDGQPAHGLDVAQRPRAVPRQRRAFVPEHTAEILLGNERDNAVNFPARSSSLQNASSETRSSGTGNDSDDSFVVHDFQDAARSISDLHSPPLERGIFDDAVSIRRSIEENASFQQPQLEQHGLADGLTHESDSQFQSILSSQQPSTQSFDFASLANRNESREFTFTSATPLDQSFTSHAEPSLEPVQQNRNEDIAEIQSNDSHGQPFSTGGFLATESPIPDDTIAESQTAAATGEEIDTDVAAPIEGSIESTQHESMLDRIADWLWHTPETDPRNPTLRVTQSRNADQTADIGVPDHGHAMPAARPVPIPVPAPVPVAERAHEPNVQFGIDLNDPNAMDDAEDLEGILELIGMEGALAGMVQNLIFSVFLITFTLLASVWCPYIWGKNALLVMSHPIGVFVRAPLFLMSHAADMLLDLSLLIVGVLGLVFTNVTRVAKYLAIMVIPTAGKYIKITSIESFAIKMTQTSSVRLEKALSVTVFHLRPDLPTVSMQSHHALRVFKAAFSNIASAVGKDVFGTLLRAQGLWQSRGLLSIPVFIFQEVVAFPSASLAAAKNISAWAVQLSSDLHMPMSSDEIDVSLLEWSPKDKILATVIGYFFLALTGSAYLKLAHLFMGLKKDEKVEGIFADSLRQAGGVMKVIFIIGIEMIFFPLYCGFLLDVALLPLFKDATLENRLQFVADAPITGLFVHWFIGTCYMFHFALFVSMCRKIMRKGVLYFIRDPDDPTFHPVRDVLERPVLTQLSKITFSALVYGGLLLVCLGGVIWTISTFGNVFPIQWATNEPRLAFPADVMFFNFLLPLAVRTAEPSKRITSMYDWWFRKCARYLRLSHFLFGDEQKDEMKARSWVFRGFGSHSHAEQDKTSESDGGHAASGKPSGGYWVRAPASDAVRIPKGTKVFLEVDQNNNRLDGQEERAKGLHGKEDERFAKIFVPRNFRARVAFFIFLVWLFASCTGAAFTLGPLLLGRALLYSISGSGYAPNDLYAFTIGLHLSGAILMLLSFIHTHQMFSASKWAALTADFRATILKLGRKIRYFFGLLYLAVTFSFVIPILLSLLAELYVSMPIYGYLMASSRMQQVAPDVTETTKPAAPSPTIHLAQSWTLGVLLFRLLLRAALRYPNRQSRLAVAIRAVVRKGLLHPDVALASRALVLPLLLSSVVLLALPIALAQGYISSFGITGHDKLTVYRHAYPVLLLTVLALYLTNRMRHKIENWQVRVRDEIYLVGERLHNFADASTDKKHATTKTAVKGKARELHNNEPEPFVEEGQNIAVSSGTDSEQQLRHRSGHPRWDSIPSHDHEVL